MEMKTLTVAAEICGLTRMNKSPRTKLGKSILNKKKQIKFDCKYLSHKSNKFILISDNRPTKKDKLIKMMSGISFDGAPTPITVIETKDGYIIVDGQHRALCCYMLGYDIGYNVLNYKDTHIPIVEYIRNLNTGQSNWTTKNYTDIGKAEQKKVYDFIENLRSQVNHLGADFATKAIFNDKSLKFKDVRDTIDMLSFLSDRDFILKDLTTNSAKFRYYAERIINIFSDGTGISMAFTSGFTDLLVNVGIWREDLEDFITYMDDKQDEYSWDINDVIPQTNSGWKSFFTYEWDQYLKSI